MEKRQDDTWNMMESVLEFWEKRYGIQEILSWMMDRGTHREKEFLEWINQNVRLEDYANEDYRLGWA